MAVTNLEAFDLTQLDSTSRRLVEEALTVCDFDLRRILPKLKAEKGRDAVPITMEDLSNFGVRPMDDANTIPPPKPGNVSELRHHEGDVAHRKAPLGLAYYSGKVVLHSGLKSNPPLLQEVTLAEVAHMVDFFVLTPEQRKTIFELFHEPGEPLDHGHGWFEETGNNDYWSWVGEAWMYGFTQAFAPSFMPGRPTGFHHTFTAEDVQKVRTLLAPPTQPDPSTKPKPLYYLNWLGWTFHRIEAHTWMTRSRVFFTREEALSTGRRPCSFCKP